MNDTKSWSSPNPEDAARYIKYLPTLANAIDNIDIGIFPITVTVDVLAPQLHIIVGD